MEAQSLEGKPEEPSCPRGPRVPLRSHCSETVEDPGPARPAVPQRSKVKAADVTDAATTDERPVPAPRRSLAPTPAPRTRILQTSTTTEDTVSRFDPSSSSAQPHRVSPQTSGSSKAKPKHPWLSIIYPSPWTRPPPTPTDPPPHYWTLPPSELPFYRHKRRTRASPSMRGRIDEDEEDQRSSEIKAEVLESHTTRGGQNHPGPQLPRSLSVPSTCSQTVLRSAASQAVLPKSKTSHQLSSRRSSAPGHGFPLIKRQVRTTGDGSVDALLGERASLDLQLKSLDLRGAELERRLRTCGSGGGKMMRDWLALVQERNVVVRRDVELAQLVELQSLEERQADVEYELRCLLNKPESKWSDEDRAEEQQLMNSLVSVIEERNKIINTLEQDRQREQDEDKHWLDVMKNKALQREGLQEMRRSKETFSLTNVWKLSHKTESRGPEEAS